MIVCWPLLNLSIVELLVAWQSFVFKTQTGDLPVHVHLYPISWKTRVPLPEKYHGLKTIDLEYWHGMYIWWWMLSSEMLLTGEPVSQEDLPLFKWGVSWNQFRIYIASPEFKSCMKKVRTIGMKWLTVCLILNTPCLNFLQRTSLLNHTNTADSCLKYPKLVRPTTRWKHGRHTLTQSGLHTGTATGTAACGTGTGAYARSGRYSTDRRIER